MKISKIHFFSLLLLYFMSNALPLSGGAVCSHLPSAKREPKQVNLLSRALSTSTCKTPSILSNWNHCIMVIVFTLESSKMKPKILITILKLKYYTALLRIWFLQCICKQNIVYFATTPKSPCKKVVGTVCCHITVKYCNFSKFNSLAHLPLTVFSRRIFLHQELALDVHAFCRNSHLDFLQNK